MSPEEILHLRARAMVHRQQARQANDPRVGRIHDELADLYEAALLNGSNAPDRATHRSAPPAG